MIGWLFVNPDTGTEFSEQHPIRSGEVPDATNIRRATNDALKAELLEAWRGWEEARNALGAIEVPHQAAELATGYSHSEAVKLGYLCDDCPPPGYPTDKTRCAPCPARSATHPPVGEKAAADGQTMGERR